MTMTEREQFEEMQREVYGDKVVDWDATVNTTGEIIVVNR